MAIFDINPELREANTVYDKGLLFGDAEGELHGAEGDGMVFPIAKYRFRSFDAHEVAHTRGSEGSSRKSGCIVAVFDLAPFEVVACNRGVGRQRVGCVRIEGQVINIADLQGQCRDLAGVSVGDVGQPRVHVAAIVNPRTVATEGDAHHLGGGMRRNTRHILLVHTFVGAHLLVVMEVVELGYVRRVSAYGTDHRGTLDPAGGITIAGSHGGILLRTNDTTYLRDAFHDARVVTIGEMAGLRQMPYQAPHKVATHHQTAVEARTDTGRIRQ